MKTSTTTRSSVSLLGLTLAVVGCGFGQSGVEAPPNRIFFPAGIAVDPAGQWLYAVNSNSDLRFNAGTVVAIDLDKANTDRGKTWDRCPSSVFAEPPADAANFCCRDFIDDGILNCDERGYIQASATVGVGSFGGTIMVQNLERPDAPGRRRLFVAVRAEPSLTFVDVTAGKDSITMRCTPEEAARSNAFCHDDWRINGVRPDPVTNLQFQEEPHSMLLDDQLGVLYVGHLGGQERGRAVGRGISVVDVCPGGRPRLASILPLALPRSISNGVTSLTREFPGDPGSSLYATAEGTSEIAELVHRDPSRVVCGVEGRDLSLVAGRGFAASAYGTQRADLRGLVLLPEQQRGYLLHRQFAFRGEFNPPSVVAIDRRPDERGRPINQSIGTVEVCSGPNRMIRHDAGRGVRLFVNCFEGGQVYVVEPNLMAIEAVIEVGAGPTELVFAPERRTRAYVAGFANNNVSIIDLEPGSRSEYRVIQRIGFARPRAVQR